MCNFYFLHCHWTWYTVQQRGSIYYRFKSILHSIIVVSILISQMKLNLVYMYISRLKRQNDVYPVSLKSKVTRSQKVKRQSDVYPLASIRLAWNSATLCFKAGYASFCLLKVLSARHFAFKGNWINVILPLKPRYV